MITKKYRIESERDGVQRFLVDEFEVKGATSEACDEQAEKIFTDAPHPFQNTTYKMFLIKVIAEK